MRQPVLFFAEVGKRTSVESVVVRDDPLEYRIRLSSDEDLTIPEAEDLISKLRAAVRLSNNEVSRRLREVGGAR